MTDPKLKAARAFIEKLFTEYDVWACETPGEKKLLATAAEICEWDQCEHCREYIWPGNGVTIQTEPTELYGRKARTPARGGNYATTAQSRTVTDRVQTGRNGV